MPARTRDENVCFIPPSRTMNAAQYASNPRQPPAGGSSATPATSSPVSAGPSTIHPASLETQLAMTNPPEERSISRTDGFPSDITKKLWKIFLTKVAPTLPAVIIETGKLSSLLAVAINHGEVGYNTIDPTLGICLAIGSLMSRDPQLWDSRK